MDTTERAIQLFRSGHVHEAESLCERRLDLAPHDVAALSLLAEIQAAAERHDRACILLARLIELAPRDAASRRRLAGSLLALGRAEEAADALLDAIKIEPSSARAHNNLGQALRQLGRNSQAILSYQEALRLDPGYAIAHNNLGLAYTLNGELGMAQKCFRRALALSPALATAELNLAIVFDQLDQPADALQSYERALVAAPHLVEAWIGRGSTLAKLNRWQAALDCFGQAHALRPGEASILTHQACALLAMERDAESLTSAEAALQIDSNSAQAHNVRAGALRRLRRHPEALQSLERALELEPGYVDAWGNRGTVLYEMGLFAQAVASCRKAIELDPGGLQARTRLLARLIPSVPMSMEEVSGARPMFDLHLTELQSWLNGRRLSEADAMTVAQQQFFYLSYEEQSNRAVLEQYRGACARRLASVEGLRAAPRAPRTGDAAGQRFKLGFFSAHVFDHSVFNAILRGWLQCLDRDRFDIALFSIGTRQDALTRMASASVDHFEAGTKPLADWARVIQDRDLDALIFPEIGMNEPTLALASLRLARRQLVAWGHPETSGLPTMDGYLSADLFEPQNGQDHYSETLVRLPNLGVHCERYAVTSTPVDLESLGVERDAPVLICPGVPFKYRPQHDWIFVEIARRIGRCTFVFFHYQLAELSHKLQQRMALAFERGNLDAGEYLRFIPWQPRDAFLGLMEQADVYLDTIGFSGFNTLMQAIECTLPCVTYEGRFMRGRLGSGILERLELPQLVARDAHGYIDLAVRLAADGPYRATIREQMRRGEARLYGDTTAIDALSAYLLESRST